MELDYPKSHTETEDNADLSNCEIPVIEKVKVKVAYFMLEF